MNYPSKIFENAVYEISQLPSIGKRTALRMVLHLLRQNPQEVMRLIDSLQELIEKTRYCQQCYNVSDVEICNICANPERTEQLICVVEDVRDVMAIESTQSFKGKFHVLGGVISPIDGIGPSQLNIEALRDRITANTEEIIFALNGSIESDTTMFYIYRLIKDQPHVKISMLSRGIAVGDTLEYTDEITLTQSILDRVPYMNMLHTV